MPQEAAQPSRPLDLTGVIGFLDRFRYPSPLPEVINCGFWRWVDQNRQLITEIGLWRLGLLGQGASRSRTHVPASVCR